MATMHAQLHNYDYRYEHKELYDHASALYAQAQKEPSSELLAAALNFALKARAIRPDYLLGLNLLARIELQRQNYAAAELWVDQGLKLKPNSVNLLYSAGQIAFQQQQLQDAEHYFEQVLKVSRVATKALNMLAHIKLLQGDFPEAFRHYRELAKTQSKDLRVRSKLFEAAAQLQADFYAEELELDLLSYLDFSDVDYSQLRHLATSLLRHKLKLSETGCPLELEALAADELLLKCLTKFYFTDPIFERLFITLRQSLLLSCSRSLAIPQHLLPLITSLAQQCWLNESVWYISEQEHKLVEQLTGLCSKMLTLPNISSNDLYPALLLVMMYQPISQLPFAKQLLNFKQPWPTDVEEHIQMQLLEISELHNQAQLLQSFSQVEDATSTRVQQQYNHFPYPRWREIGYNEPSDYASALRQAFPQHVHVLPQTHQPLKALVAGCGTGRHAIRLAKYFPSLTVTAMDLSHSALAYAATKAQEHASLGINFIQGDLLAAQQLPEKYDLIECSGVLHHMHNPSAGLKALSDQLKPGGIIKIALYSATARQQITALRQLLGSQLPKDSDSMRLVREALMQQSLPGNWDSILSSPDFYSLSACRDLIFHEQEHVFNVLELPEFLAQANLKWLGMLAPSHQQALLELTGLPAGQISVAQWHQLEQNNPSLFAGMYQFYAIKQP